MTFTYDLETDIGKVRLAIPDRNASDATFSDEELQSFLDIEGDWMRAAANALEVMAGDIAISVGDARVQNIETRGSNTSSALLKRAAQLRQRADEIDAEGDAGFDIAEQIFSDANYRQNILNEFLRLG
jgi:hypothetical protein